MFFSLSQNGRQRNERSLCHLKKDGAKIFNISKVEIRHVTDKGKHHSQRHETSQFGCTLIVLSKDETYGGNGQIEKKN